MEVYSREDVVIREEMVDGAVEGRDAVVNVADVAPGM